jgi:hypothetical protein
LDANAGILVQTAADTFLKRSIAASGVGISITNPDGAAGDITVVSNATDTNTASTIVARDASGGFSMGALEASSIETTGDVTVGGNLKVNGTTTAINSTVTTIVDPVLNIGGGVDGAVLTTDDNKDRGIEFNYYEEGAAKVGFFGYDDSTGFFTFLVGATNTSEVFSGTKGTLDAKVEWTNIQTTPTTLSGYGITDAQPLDPTLTAMAGVTTAADKIIYFTGEDTAAATTLSEYGRSLIDDATAADARATLGILGVLAYDHAGNSYRIPVS